MADKKRDTLSTIFGFMQNGSAIAQAMLEDYANVVSKIDGSTPEEISSRVKQRANEILSKYAAEVKESTSQQTSEGSNPPSL